MGKMEGKRNMIGVSQGRKADAMIKFERCSGAEVDGERWIYVYTHREMERERERHAPRIT